MRCERRVGKIGNVQLASGLVRAHIHSEGEHSIVHCTFERREGASQLYIRGGTPCTVM
jgi:hypothetical protein